MSDLAPPPGFELETGNRPVAPPPRAAAPPTPAVIPPSGFEPEAPKVEEGQWQRGAVLPVEKNTTTGKVRLAVPQVAKDVIDAIMTPGDVAQGNIDLNTPEGMDRLVGLAGLATTGVTPRPSARVLTEAGKVVPKPVARAIRSDGMTPEQVAPKLQDLGPDAVLADAGPNLQKQAAAVATVPGAGQKTILDTMTARKAGAPDRLRNELDTTLGPAPVPAQVHAGLKAEKKLLSPEYEAALAPRGGDKDETLTWFLDGDKNVYVNSSAIQNHAGVEGWGRLSQLDNYQRLDGVIPGTNPGERHKASVWYKPGHEAEAQEALKASQLPWGTPEQDWQKHFAQGVAYGYGDDKARAYASTRAPEAPQAVPPSKIDLHPVPEQFRNGGAVSPTVDTTELAASLDKEIPALRGKAQEALVEVRKWLNKTGGEAVNDPVAVIAAETDPAKRRELARRHLAGEPLETPAPLDDSARTLMATREAIDGLIKPGMDNNVFRVLTNTRKSVDEILGAAVPGIKEIDAKYQTLAKQGEAFDRGQTVLGSGRDTPRPAELRSEVNQVIAGGGDPKALQQLTQGARAEIDRIVGTNLNDRAALNGLLKGEGDWNYDRLTTLFGKEKTDRIYKVLDSERTYATTENLADAGSKTAAVTAAQAEVASPTKGPGILQATGDMKFGTAAKRAGEAVIGGIADRRKAASNSNIADVIMGNGPLKSDIYGQPVPLTPLIEAIMRSDQSGRSPAQGADRERLKRSVNNKVY